MSHVQDRICEMKSSLEKKGFGLRQLSNRSGVSFSTLWRWELGKHSPSIETFQKVEKAFDLLIAENSPATDEVA